MATTYAGDPDNFPDEVQLPSDGDDLDAASVNAALEGLADRTASLAMHREYEFTSGGTLVVPDGVTSVEIELFGGGGAGGIGAQPTASPSDTTKRASGGGGGGAGQHVIKRVSVTPGMSIVMIIGTGGVVGPGVDSWADVGTTSFAVYASGGRQGAPGVAVTHATEKGISPGGGPDEAPATAAIVSVDPTPQTIWQGYGIGGAGISFGAGRAGNGYGGSGGAVGTDGGSYLGGGGGGGGAWGYGAAGDGGAGGNGNAAGSGAAGSSGASAAANTAAGGGGGGAGGGGSSGGGAGGAGGNGGSGIGWIRYFGTEAVVT